MKAVHRDIKSNCFNRLQLFAPMTQFFFVKGTPPVSFWFQQKFRKNWTKYIFFIILLLALLFNPFCAFKITPTAEVFILPSKMWFNLFRNRVITKFSHHLMSWSETFHLERSFHIRTNKVRHKQGQNITFHMIPHYLVVSTGSTLYFKTV